VSTHGGEETWSMTLKNIYTNLDNIRNMIPGKQIKPVERKGKEQKVEEISTSCHTYPNTNMQVRLMTQLPFEAFDAWTSVDTI
jgi:hypothetical protein